MPKKKVETQYEKVKTALACRKALPSGDIHLSKKLDVVFLGSQKYVLYEGKKLERRACKRPKYRNT